MSRKSGRHKSFFFQKSCTVKLDKHEQSDWNSMQKLSSVWNFPKVTDAWNMVFPDWAISIFRNHLFSENEIRTPRAVHRYGASKKKRSHSITIVIFVFFTILILSAAVFYRVSTINIANTWSTTHLSVNMVECGICCNFSLPSSLVRERVIQSKQAYFLFWLFFSIFFIHYAYFSLSIKSQFSFVRFFPFRQIGLNQNTQTEWLLSLLILL